jgi:tRNA U34 5-carboxymethylaminomethyl modifying enzyme MnmG/GidA
MEDESLVLDPDIDYQAMSGLSLEVRERLVAARPTSIVRFSVLMLRCHFDQHRFV